jgi:hypothetical protein
MAGLCAVIAQLLFQAAAAAVPAVHHAGITTAGLTGNCPLHWNLPF